MTSRDTTAKTIADLGNAPPTVLEQSQVREHAELYGSSQVRAARWFTAACVQLPIIVVLVVVLSVAAKNSQLRPYVVAVDSASGELVGRPVAAREFKPQVEENRMAIAAEAKAFVRELLTIDPFVMRANHERAKARMAGQALSEFKSFLVVESPYERVQKIDGLTRTVSDPMEADASQPGIVFVTAQTSERVTGSDALVKRWRFTIHYSVKPALSPAGLSANPLGFAVTHFERIQENTP